MKKGFTLIELIVVIAILAILGGILVPKISGYQEKAKKSRYQHSAINIIHAVWGYNADKKDRISTNIVLTEKVSDTDKVSDVLTLAINAESSSAILTQVGETYNGLKDLTLAELSGVSKSNFKLKADGSIDTSSIISGTINN